ncbi:unnamed protein product [Plutella xylostella]|uniref:(diamondback moth) hypothetical protein n=1 Tax=Plutella xylostella TaxID=51655 RepID=A0A8S4EHQ2_PLUXY|nr:unnamed protein product [Plutella xylostella]
MEDDYDDDEPFIYRLNDNGTGPGLLIKICAERGWRLYQGYSGGEEKWNLWWRTSAFPAACYKALGDWQFMNHIPKGGSICRKDSLSRLLRCMRKIYGSIYDFRQLGVWGTQGRAFIKELGRRLRDRGHGNRSGAYLMQRISLAVQRGNAASVMGTFGSDSKTVGTKLATGGATAGGAAAARLSHMHHSLFFFSSSPPSYHLPLEYAKLVSECARLRRGEEAPGVVWIHKPVAQSQGRGIFLFRVHIQLSAHTEALLFIQSARRGGARRGYIYSCLLILKHCCSSSRRGEEAPGVVWIHKPVAQSQGRGIFLFRVHIQLSAHTEALLFIQSARRGGTRRGLDTQARGAEPEPRHLPVQGTYTAVLVILKHCCSSSRSGGGVVWIHKPVAQSQGRGIFLFRSVCEMRCGSAAVVQRYIERPLLIAGYKFDLRLYVCVPGYRPLTAYMYADGLARFGTDKYTLSDIHNPYRHLTNSSLNKTGPRYAECKDRIGSGCKWTLKQVRRALIGRWGVTEWLVWQRIRALVTLTLLAQAAGTPPAKNCFEFYGFDVLLDDTLKPWLIEVNLSPALASDCEADVTVKRPMLHELFDLLGLPMRHTGLALLQGPAQTTCSSDDENASLPRPRTTKSPVVSAGRRGTRWRRRRTLPIHCVTLQPPMSDKFIETKEANGGRSSKSLSELSTDNSDEQSPSSSTTSSDPPEEPCRYTTAHRKRLSSAAGSWGNGVRWDRAPGRTGQWVRIFPHVLPHDDQLGMEDIREGVAQVSKLTRAAREVARESARDPRPRDGARDAALDAALRDKLGFGPHFQMFDRRATLLMTSYGGQTTQVSKLTRAAREVARESARDPRPRDGARDAALRDKLGFGPHFQVWLPPF